jgi:hypothetical protein
MEEARNAYKTLIGKPEDHLGNPYVYRIILNCVLKRDTNPTIKQIINEGLKMCNQCRIGRGVYNQSEFDFGSLTDKYSVNQDVESTVNVTSKLRNVANIQGS